MLSRFLAQKIYNNSEGTNKVSLPAVRIATAGMAIGLAVMIISISVVFGFKHTIRDKVIGFGSHITISNFNGSQIADAFPICTGDSLLNALKAAPGVNHIQRVAFKQGILKTEEEFLGVMLKGVGEDWDSTFIHNNMVAGSIPQFSSEKSSNQLLLSQMIADKLNLKVGDKIFAYFVGGNVTSATDVDEGDLSSSVRMRKMTVSGIYQTNMTRFDESICFTDIYSAVKLNGWNKDEANGVEITVKDFDKLDETASWMIKHINRGSDKYGNPYTSTKIQESYPQVFQWLNLLDLNVWIILALMICVASVTMISGLLIIILERVPMIGILKALGARNGTVRHTFLWFAQFILIKGLIIGDVIGIGLCLLQKYTGLVTLDPQTYYVSQAPVELNIPIIIALNIATLIVCTLILIVPSLLVSHISPVKSMKFQE